MTGRRAKFTVGLPSWACFLITEMNEVTLDQYSLLLLLFLDSGGTPASLLHGDIA